MDTCKQIKDSRCEIIPATWQFLKQFGALWIVHPNPLVLTPLSSLLSTLYMLTPFCQTQKQPIKTSNFNSLKVYE